MKTRFATSIVEFMVSTSDSLYKLVSSAYDPFHIDLRMSEIGIVNKSVHLLKSSLYEEASAYITHQRSTWNWWGKPGITIQYSIQYMCLLIEDLENFW